MKNKHTNIKKILNKKITLKNNFSVENEFYYTTHKSRLDKILNHYELIKRIKNVQGEIVELGVFKGISLIRIAQIRDTLKIKKKIYGFDTFKSFPSSGKSDLYDKAFPKSFTKVAGKPISKITLEKVLKKKQLKNIKLVEGDIFKTLNFLKKNKTKISLLHLDMDVEKVTFFALELLYKNLVKGGVIILDDYKIHPGIKRAVDRILKKKKIFPPIYGKNPFYFIKN